MASINPISFSFLINSSLTYSPAQFNDQSHCAVTNLTFKELMSKYFETHLTTPYFVALVEDTAKCSTLCDLSSLYTWYKKKGWATAEFRSPASQVTCERVRLYAIDRFGLHPLCTVKSAIDFRKYFMDLSNQILLSECGSMIMTGNSLTARVFGSHSEIDSLHFSDDEIMSWIKFQLSNGMFITKTWFFDFLYKGDNQRANVLLIQLARWVDETSLDEKVTAQLYPILVECFSSQKATYNLERAVHFLKRESVLHPLRLEDRNFQILLCKLSGMLSLSQGMHIDALNDFHKLEKLYGKDPESLPEVYCLLGETYKLLGDFEEAKNYLWMSLELIEPHYGTIAFQDTYLHFIEIERILQDFEKAYRHLTVLKTFLEKDDRHHKKTELKTQEQLLNSAYELFQNRK